MTPRLVTFFLLSLLIGNVQAQHTDKDSTSCASIKDINPLLQPGSVILFGEMHGTNESPQFLGQALCLALEQGHTVTVGLEIPFSETPRLKAYLDSSGDPQDVADVLQGDFWQRPFQDGRSSQAMLALIEQLRVYRAAGAPVIVILLDNPEATKRDVVMTEHLHSAMEATPSSVFLVLTGNIHNRLTVGTSWDDAYEPMGYLLHQTSPERERPIYALDVAYEGGEAWVCFGSAVSDCGVQQLRGNAENGDGVDLESAPEASAYSGRYHVGRLTASPPAIAKVSDQ